MLALDSKYLEYKPIKKDARRKMSVGGYDIMRIDIPNYLSEYFNSCFLIWQRWKTFGLPFAPLGYAEHPDYLIRIYEAFNAAQNLSKTRQPQPQKGVKRGRK